MIRKCGLKSNIWEPGVPYLSFFKKASFWEYLIKKIVNILGNLGFEGLNLLI